jgi:hypothetical protein
MGAPLGNTNAAGSRGGVKRGRISNKRKAVLANKKKQKYAKEWLKREREREKKPITLGKSWAGKAKRKSTMSSTGRLKWMLSKSKGKKK